MKLKPWLIAPLFAIALASCGPKETAEGDGKTPTNDSAKALKIGVVYDSGGRGDKSFNDSAWDGIERAKKEFGIEALEVETKAAKDYINNLSSMAEEGCDLVIAVGLAQTEPLKEVATKYPNTKFAIVDGDSSGLDNIRSLKFNEEEGSYMVGYLAGLMSKTGKFGFIGGKEIPLIKKFQYGYFAGVKMANPAATLLPAKYTGNWDNVDTAKAAANMLFDDGADVVYAAAGRAGLGALKAASDRKVFAIGVDSDQDYLYPGTVLTSMVKRVDNAVFNTIKDLKAGSYEKGDHTYTLKEGGVGISELKHTKDLIGAEKLTKLEEVKAKIESGEIKVPATEEDYKAAAGK